MNIIRYILKIDKLYQIVENYNNVFPAETIVISTTTVGT